MKTVNLNAITRLHLFIENDGAVLMTKHGNVYMPLIGYIESGEGVKERAIRLASEEARIILREEDIEIFGLLHDEVSYSFFLASKTPQTYTTIAELTLRFEWLNINQLPSNVPADIRAVLQDYRMGIRFNSVEDISYRKAHYE